MSARVANCPSCGAAIEFAHAAAVMVVCGHCGTASVRRGVTLEKLGRVAEIAPIDSPLSLGTSGRWRGRRWSAIGQVQLDHGAGPWNEWCLLFEDGTTGWLAEAQGEYLVTFRRTGLASPLDQELAPGAKVALGDETYVVAEAGSARVTSVRGELPEELTPEERYEYFDLRGAGNRFATVAVHRDGSWEAYVGESTTLAALDIDASTVEAAAPRRATPDRIGCPSCGTAIQIRDPANCQRTVCSSCGTMTDPRDEKLRVIEKAKRLEARPVLPIGAKTTVAGDDVEVLGFLVRSVRSYGVKYPWREYLLKRKDGAYLWLIETDGHWTIARPASLGDVSRDDGLVRYRGQTYRHFQGGHAVVDHVQGEVYWEVSIGETVKADDYVAPPRMVSFEKSGKEVVASVGEYVPLAEIAAAFPGVVNWPPQSGIAPNQPNPYAARRGPTWALAGVLCAAVLVVMIVFGIWAAKRTVATVNGISPGPAPAAPAAPGEGEADAGVVFSDEFRLEPSVANVKVHLTAGVGNSWLGIDGALVNLDTGDVHSFALEAERWSGVTEGEAWSEGEPDATTYLGSIPAGRYALRLDSEGQGQGGVPVQINWRVQVTSQVPSPGRGVALLFVLLVAPVFVTAAASIFESRRWATSDHAPQGDDDE